MTITRQDNLPFEEKSIIFTKELETDYDGDGKTALSKLDEEINGQSALDMSKFDCFAQGSEKIARSNILVSDKGFMFRIGSIKNFETKSLYAVEKSGVGFIAPSELDEAFNNAELNDFITTLLPIFTKEVETLQAALAGNKNTGEEILAKVKEELGTPDASLKDVFGLLYNEEAINGLEPKNLLDLAQLHFEYLNAALTLSTNDITDAEGNDYVLKDEAAVKAIVDQAQPEKVKTDLAAAADPYAYTQDPANNFLPSLFLDNSGEATGVTAPDATVVGGPDDFDNYADADATAKHFNALIKQINENGGAIINQANDSPIQQFSVSKNLFGQKSLEDEEGKKAKILINGVVVKANFRKGDDYAAIRTIHVYLHDALVALNAIPEVDEVEAPTVAVVRIDNNTFLPADVTSKGYKDAEGKDITTIKGKVILDAEGNDAGVELYADDATTGIKLDGDTSTHKFPTAQAFMDWVGASNAKEVESQIILNTINTLFAQAEVDFGKSGNTTLVNTGAVDRLVNFLINNKEKIATPLKITVTGFASPDGGHAGNKTLADKRGGVVAAYMDSKLKAANVSIITVVPTTHDHVATSYSDTTYYRPTRIAEIHAETSSAPVTALPVAGPTPAPSIPAPAAPVSSGDRSVLGNFTVGQTPSLPAGQIAWTYNGKTVRTFASAAEFAAHVNTVAAKSNNPSFMFELTIAGKNYQITAVSGATGGGGGSGRPTTVAPAPSRGED